MQHIQLYKISRASKSHCNDNAPEAETRRLIFEDKNGDRIVCTYPKLYQLYVTMSILELQTNKNYANDIMKLEVEADSIVERDMWVESFDAAFHFLSSDIKSSEKMPIGRYAWSAGGKIYRNAIGLVKSGKIN